MDLKKELLLGVIGSALIIGLMILIIISYPRPQMKQNNNQPRTKALTISAVAKHNRPEDCWVIIKKEVYEVTDFLSLHPGGKNAIIPYCGKDASQAFATRGDQGPHPNSAREKLKTLKIGQL